MALLQKLISGKRGQGQFPCSASPLKPSGFTDQSSGCYVGPIRRKNDLVCKLTVSEAEREGGGEVGTHPP